MFKLRSSLKVLFGIIIWGLIAVHAQAAKPLKITITSDHAELSRQDNKSIYTGNVTVKRGSVTLHGDKLVTTGATSQNFQAVLTGEPATFKRLPVQKDEKATHGHAQKIDYDNKAGKIILTGNAFIDQDGDTINGTVIEHTLGTEHYRAQGSKDGNSQIKMVLTPDEQ